MDEAIDEAIRERSKALLDSSLGLAAGIHYSAPRQKEARALFERLVQENRVQDLLDAAIEEGERAPAALLAPCCLTGCCTLRFPPGILLLWALCLAQLVSAGGISSALAACPARAHAKPELLFARAQRTRTSC